MSSIVGGHDVPVIGLNREALAQLRVTKGLMIVPSATHLFEEPGALEQVTELARAWFRRHLAPAGDPGRHQPVTSPRAARRKAGETL